MAVEYHFLYAGTYIGEVSSTLFRYDFHVVRVHLSRSKEKLFLNFLKLYYTDEKQMVETEVVIRDVFFSYRYVHYIIYIFYSTSGLNADFFFK